MTMQIEAIYENGSLHPVGPLPLVEHQRVTVTISALGEPSRLDVAYIEEAKREVSKMACIPTLLEVQERLSKISGSIAHEIEAEHRDH